MIIASQEERKKTDCDEKVKENQSEIETESKEEDLNENEMNEAMQKYQDEVKALEQSYFKELMKDCETSHSLNVKDCAISEPSNQKQESVFLKQQNEIIRTAKENVENRINRLNEIEIIKTDNVKNQKPLGSHLKGSHLDKKMLNDAESAVYVLQGKEFTKMGQINDEAYVKINGQYVRASDSVNERNETSGTKPTQHPNDVLKQLKQIVDQNVADVQLVTALRNNLDQPTNQLLELYNQQLKLYNQRVKQPPSGQVLKSQCNKTNTTYGANDLKKMTEISVEISKPRQNQGRDCPMTKPRQGQLILNPINMTGLKTEHVRDLTTDVDGNDLTDQIDFLKNLSPEDIRCFSQCTFCSFSLNVSNLTELLIHCRECPTLDRAEGRFTYICYVCGVYNTSKSTNMKKHLLTHFGHKAFSCDVCPYTCVSRSDLQRHVRKHTGEKPYACHLCAYRSSRTETLKKHLASVHKITHANYSIPELNVYNALLNGDASVLANHSLM